MSAILSALISAFAVIGLGYLISRRGWMTDDMWSGLQHIAYYVLFPSLVISSLVRADLGNAPVGGMVAVFVTAMAAMCLILVAFRPLLLGWFGLSGPRYSSVFQGSIRWHTFLALAIIASAYGDDGVALAAIAVATIIPIANVLSVVVITAHSSHGIPRPKRFLKIVFTNPFVLSSIGGTGLNVLGIPIVEPLAGTLDLLGSGATGIGLIVVGAGLKFRAINSARGGVALAVVLKLAVMPALVYGAALLWEVTGTALAVALVAAAVPTATGSYILARQLGGDAEYVAGILTVQIIVAAATLPAILWLATG